MKGEMKKSLRVLLVEDSEFDAQMLVALLKKGGYAPDYRRVETAQEMTAALREKKWDIILADYNLPQFSAPEALRLLHESGLDLPFIIVSGAIGEQTAVDSMKAGAHDYLMKGNLARLVPAVERELRESANRLSKRETTEALRESELRYRLLWETATDAVILIDPGSTIHFANPAVEEVFGYKPAELVGEKLSKLQPDWLRDERMKGIRHYLETGKKKPNWRAMESVGRRKDGAEIAVELAFSHMELEGKRWFVGFFRDVTERKRAEKELKENQEQFRVAHEIQQHLFPKKPPGLPGFDIAGHSNPAEATGGDYFDYVPMPDGRMGMVIGDVTGHGVGPALLMAETRAYLRVLAKTREHVGEILTRANIVLAEDVGYERFVTLILVQLDAATKTLTYANAGHPAGYILGETGEVKTLLKRTGMPLGLRPDTTYSAAAPIPLAAGDIILLLTDGFEEAVSPDDRVFGIDRVLQVVREHRKQSAQQIVKFLYEALDDFSDHTPPSDDLTVVVIKVT
jgi:PAS domain S-box-containing protein